MNEPATLKATYRLQNVKIDTPVSISNFILEPVPGHPNDTYLRFEFTPKKDPYSESQKEVESFSLVLSILCEAGSPELETITTSSGQIVEQAAGPSIRNPISFKQTDFAKIEQAYKNVKSMSSKKEIFDFVSRWIQKANDAYYLYERFIFYWIAFNFLYGRMPVEGERRKIEQWVNEYCKDPCPSEFFADFQQSKRESPEYKAIDHLAKANLKVKRLKKPPINLSLKLLQKISNSEFDLEALKYLVLCIYVVRNSLFHSEWSYLDEATTRQVAAARFVLSKLIKHGLKKQCNFPF